MGDKLDATVSWLAANPEACVFLALMLIAMLVGLERLRHDG